MFKTVKERNLQSRHKKKSLDKILPGQELILNSSLFSGKIPETFSPDDEIDF